MADGAEVGVYRVHPAGERRGGLVRERTLQLFRANRG